MYNRILVPVGQSEKSEQVLDSAVEFASRFDSEVHLVHVLNLRFERDVVYNIKEIAEKEKARREEHLKELSETFQSNDVSVRTEVLNSFHTPERILEYVGEEEIDLVMMASHCRSGVSRLFLGSTTERVLRGSKEVPILVVPMEKEEQERS